MRRATGTRCRFDHIRVDRTLRQEAGIFKLCSFFFKDIDKQLTDNLAFVFRITNTIECVEKAFFRIHSDDIDPHIVSEGLHDLIAFVQTQQAIVNKYTSQLLADSAVQQRRDD